MSDRMRMRGGFVLLPKPAWARGTSAAKATRIAAPVVGLVVLFGLPLVPVPGLAAPGVNWASMLFYPVGLYVLMALGLDVMVGRTGLPNLCYAAFFAVGSYTTALLSTQLGLSAWETLVPALVAGVLFGGLLSLFTARTSGHYFAIITLGAGLLVVQVISNIDVFGGTLGVASIPQPTPVFGLQFDSLNPVAFCWLVFVAILVGVGVLRRISRSALGLAWAALREDELAARISGVRAAPLKASSFMIGGAFGGVAGSLYAMESGFVDPSSFGLDLSVLILASVVLVGSGRIGTVVAGAVIVAYLPERFYAIQQWNTLVFGACLAVIMIAQPRGISAAVRAAADRWVLGRSHPPDVDEAAATDDTSSRRDGSDSSVLGVPTGAPLGNSPGRSSVGTPASVVGRVTVHGAGDHAGIADDVSRQAPGGEVLKGEELVVEFGGLEVLKRVSFTLASGEILGVVGPNGAGKTTLINIVTGLYAPKSGRLELVGRSILNRSPDQRARAGIGRTFQNIRLFKPLTVVENVLVTVNSRTATNALRFALDGRVHSHASSDARDHAMDCLRLVGLDGLAHENAESLPYGQQRRLEIARAMGLSPHLLLLDEPAAGSNANERHELTLVLERIAAAGCSIMLIEHDIELVSQLSDRMMVLNFGQVICQGAPRTVVQDANVRTAYLGEEVFAS